MSFAREAILKAAAHIEQHPNEYWFGNIYLPGSHQAQRYTDDHLGRGCVTGCALGWIGKFMGVQQLVSSPLAEVALRLGHRPGRYCPQDQFYTEMDELVSPFWKDQASLCAKGLRKYADKFHPETV